MARSRVATDHRIIDAMIALGGCTTERRILMAGSNSMAMLIELHRRGYARAVRPEIAAVRQANTTSR